MKKLLLGITIFSVILFASSAMAAGPKVPKNLCFTISNGYQMLTLKSISSMSTSDGKVKMYQVTGYSETGHQGPVHGSGYVAPNTTTFHATYNKSSGGIAYTLTAFQLTFDLEAMTGTLYGRWDYDDGTRYFRESAVTTVDCSDYAIWPATE